MDPIKWRSKIILAKMEATYGTDPVPAGLNGMLMTNVEMRPMEGQDVERNVERPWLGQSERFPSGLYVMLTGSVELVGSGTAGTAPAWAPLMRACAAAEVITANTSVEYSPISDAHESCALYFWLGGTRQVITGVRGTAVLSLSATGIPTARFTLTGLYLKPTEAARVSPTLTGFKLPQVASKTNTPVFTIGGASFVLRNYELDLGNDVQPRMLIGQEQIIIVNRAERLRAQVEAVPLSTYDPFAKAESQEPSAVVIEHGTVVGRKVRIEAGYATQARLSGYANEQEILEWPLEFTPTPSAGNDQWKITLT